MFLVVGPCQVVECQKQLGFTRMLAPETILLRRQDVIGLKVILNVLIYYVFENLGEYICKGDRPVISSQMDNNLLEYGGNGCISLVLGHSPCG